MRRFLPLLGFLALPIMAVAVPVAAEDALASPFDRSLSATERLEALAARVRLAHETLETLEAEFSQVKESALLVEPDRAEGEFSFMAPDRIRWEYRTPDPISLVIADKMMTTWYRDIGQAERAEVGERSNRVVRYLGAGTSLDTLLEYFSVSLKLPSDQQKPLRLRLTPRFKRVAKRIREMELWLDPTLYLPVRLRYVEGDGDVTEYVFRNFRRNEGLPGDRFQLELPREVEVRVVRLDSRAGAR